MSESMSAEWEKWIQQESSNAETIEHQLEELSSFLDSPGDFRYREFWDHARESSEMIKTLTPLSEREREEFQDQYDRICREAKKRQSAEWETRSVKSQQMRETIMKKVQEAFSHAESGPDDIQSLNKAQSLLSEALALLKNGGERSTDESAEKIPSNNPLLRDDRQICWEKWREANDLVFGRRQIIWDQNYEEVAPGAQDALDEANDGDPFQALEKVKETQQRLKTKPLSKTQRESLRASLNGAWEIAIAKVNAVREEKKRKYEEWLERMEIQVEDWSNQHRENEATSLKYQEEIEELKEKIQSVRAKEVGDKLRDEIADKRQKIKDFERTNRQLEEKIQTIKSRIDD